VEERTKSLPARYAKLEKVVENLQILLRAKERGE
jgi:hypothetical protein